MSASCLYGTGGGFTGTWCNGWAGCEGCEGWGRGDAWLCGEGEEGVLGEVVADGFCAA